MSILHLLLILAGLIICYHFKDYQKSYRHAWLLMGWLIAGVALGMVGMATYVTKESLAPQKLYLIYGLLTVGLLGLVFYIFNSKKIQFLLLALGIILNSAVLIANKGQMPYFTSTDKLREAIDPPPPDNLPASPSPAVNPNVKDKPPPIIWPLLGDWIPIEEFTSTDYFYSPGDMLIIIGLMIFFLDKYPCQQKG